MRTIEGKSLIIKSWSNIYHILLGLLSSSIVDSQASVEKEIFDIDTFGADKVRAYVQFYQLYLQAEIVLRWLF